MDNLKLILDDLRSSHGKRKHYRIPKQWNSIGFEGWQTASNPFEITVEAIGYYTACIEKLLVSPPVKMNDALTGSVMYAMLPRTFSAWKHDEDGTIESGTFLKCIALLPKIKALGVDTIYLLPCFEASYAFLKGGLPSPYAIRDILRIDQSLHDPLLSAVSVDIEFAAFVEVCHHLGMRVMLDFVFRTAARDNVLIEEHPDWFYWIKSECAQSMTVPGIAGMNHTVVSEKNIDQLYQSPEMTDFISCFVSSPDPAVWQALLQQSRSTGQNVMDLAIQKLGICTMPGFADTINDPQPPWTDVTYLRLYFENSRYLKKHIKSNDLPPCIAQDGVKCSVFGGEAPNHALWEYLAGVIPYYIGKFGIDGARIDMGHALPVPLYTMMMDRVKEADPHFIIWSEEFSVYNAEAAALGGADFITGGIWSMWQRKYTRTFSVQLSDQLRSVLPVTAAIEMPDTPRSIALAGSEDGARADFLIASMLPHAVLLINNGQELGEIQPMNAGLLADEHARFVLPRDHPNYGKLAFFDEVYFDWAKENNQRFLLMSNMIILRQTYRELMCSIDHFSFDALRKRGVICRIAYCTAAHGIFLLVNRGKKGQHIHITQEISQIFRKKFHYQTELSLCGANKTFLPRNGAILLYFEEEKQ